MSQSVVVLPLIAAVPEPEAMFKRSSMPTRLVELPVVRIVAVVPKTEPTDMLSLVPMPTTATSRSVAVVVLDAEVTLVPELVEPVTCAPSLMVVRHPAGAPEYWTTLHQIFLMAAALQVTVVTLAPTYAQHSLTAVVLVPPVNCAPHWNVSPALSVGRLIVVELASRIPTTMKSFCVSAGDGVIVHEAATVELQP